MTTVDVERYFLSAVLLSEESEFREALEAGVSTEWFGDSENGDRWAWILDYWGEHGELPTARAIRHEWPKWKPIRVEEPLRFYVYELRKRYHFSLAQVTLLEASEYLEDRDTRSVVEAFKETVNTIELETSGARDVDAVSTWEDRLAMYKEIEDTPDHLLGVPTGFNTLDFSLGGFQDEQLITLTGLPKSGKSTIALHMAKAAHDDGYVPLFVSFEMSNKEQMARYDAMKAGIAHWRLLHGKLTKADWDKLYRAAEEAKDDDVPFWFCEDRSSVMNVTGLMAKAKQHDPDVIIVDGVYLMQPENGEPPNSPMGLTDITRNLKRMGQRMGRPVIATTQTLPSKYKKGTRGVKVDESGSGIAMESIGYTSSFVQDSDVVLGVENVYDSEDDDPDDHSQRKRISIVLARNASPRTFDIDFDWDHGELVELTEHGKPTGAEAFKRPKKTEEME